MPMFRSTAKLGAACALVCVLVLNPAERTPLAAEDVQFKQPELRYISPPLLPSVGRDQVFDTGQYTAANGQVFSYTKAIVDGEETVLYYTEDGQKLTWQEMQKYEAAHPTPVVDAALLRKASQAPAGTMFDLVVWLRHRPGTNISRKVSAARMPAIELLAKEIQAIHRAVRPKASLPPVEEENYLATLEDVASVLTPEQRDLVRKRAQEIDQAMNDMQQEITRRIKAAVADDQKRIDALINDLGGEIRGHVYSQNAVEVSLPTEHLQRLAEEPFIARIIMLPPVEPELDNQVDSLGLDGFWNDGVDGGIWDVGVLDTGVQQDHPALDHLTFLSNFGSTDSGGHGTAVAGIIASNDATYRGMAFGLDKMLVGSFASGNVMSHADWMVSSAFDDPEAINLSGGYGRANDTDYSTFDQFWDGLIDDNRVMVGKSTGNGGNGTTTITHPAPAYNLMAVANVYDQNTVTRSDDVIRSSSSRGPTDNGRKKPDIAAPGHNTLTANNDWAQPFTSDFINFTGNSAAAPHVTGAVVLVTDLRGSDNPMASKAVLINTADAWSDNGTPGNTSDDGRVFGSAWNKTYGWGYLDLWEAWFNGNDVFVASVDDGFNPPGPDFKLYKGYMWQNEKASLVWNRHVGYNGSNSPNAVEALTDLDLYVYDAANGSRLDSSLSGKDNVEQVAVSQSGNVVLKVDVFGAIDPDVGIESFALATEENFTSATPPSFTFSASLNRFFGSLYFLRVTVRNHGTVDAFNNQATVTLPGGFTLLGGSNTRNLGTIPAGGSKQATWTVSATCTFPILYNFNFSNSSSSYGESFSDAGNQFLVCGSWPFFPVQVLAP